MGCSHSTPIESEATVGAAPAKSGGVQETKADHGGGGGGGGGGGSDRQKPYDKQVTLSRHGYTCGPELGKGGFGQVYEGTLDDTGDIVAIKMISKLNFSTDKDSDNMKLETELMTRVKGHPNVVELRETFEDHAYYFLVMEKCAGGELMDRIIANQRFSEKIAASYFRMMLLGVQHCHNHGVVHRDLKPENFLFASRAEDADLKLTDFGLSCGIKHPDQIITEACGSAYYIAPEVFKRSFTRACDVWSLGVILYLLLCGTVPFGYEAEEESEVYRSIQRDKLRMDSSVWSAVSASGRELVMGLLEKEPAKRYTLEQALSHPWVNGDAAPDIPIPSQVVRSMHNFTARNKFKKEALKLIASTLSAADVAQLRETFHRIDKDNTGTITFAELSEAMRSMSMDRARIEALMKEIDTDGDGTINYEEFLIATAERQLVNHQNNIWWVFCEYDKDANGMISAEELMKIMKDQRPEQVQKYIDEFDLDNDGMINYEEFMRMVLPKDLKYKISRYT